MSYSYDDPNTTKDTPVTITVSAAYDAVSCTVSVPVNIFRKGGKSRFGIGTTNRIVSKKGKYKLYGNVTYRVTRWSSFSRPVRYDSKKKKYVPVRKKFKYCMKTRNDKYELMDDDSKFRRISK